MNLQSQYTIAQYLGAATIDPPLLRIPVMGARVQLGFPSPADDFLEDTLDLNNLLIRNPAATFFYRAHGNSMLRAGILSGDILVVDRSVTVQNGDIVLACWGGEPPICKILYGLPERIELHSANPNYSVLIPPIDVEVELYCVIDVVRQLVRGRERRVRPR
jgi:DNA polymerase V